jgi:hypothetical protein
VVPAYSVNQVLGGIPLVGGLLTGGEGEGLLAATYTLRGPLAAGISGAGHAQKEGCDKKDT